MSNQILKRQPLSSLSELHHVLDRLFERDLLGLHDQSTFSMPSAWTPKIDIKEKDNQIIIHADVPGVNPKDIDVSWENGILTIKGKTEKESKDEKENYMRVERASGSFTRAISLPDIVDAAKISAKTRNGVLEIIIPKSAKASAHRIQIKEE